MTEKNTFSVICPATNLQKPGWPNVLSHLRCCRPGRKDTMQLKKVFHAERDNLLKRKKWANEKHKESVIYRDVAADLNNNNELALLSTITTTRDKYRKACLKALSKFYKQAAVRTEKPSVSYPRNQLYIEYIKYR
ncbi:MAG: hypothetical protein ABF326_11575 [Arenicellales bacterium]